MSFKIRKMTAKDIKSVQYVAEKSWLTTYAGIIPEETQKRFLKAVYSDEIDGYIIKTVRMELNC